MLCPSCSAASLDAYGRCHHCGYSAAPPAQPYAAYYPQPRLIAPTAPAGVGLAAQILMAVSGLIAVIAFGVNIWAFTVARTAYDNPGSNPDAVNGAIGVAGIFALLSLLLGLATGIVFIVWFFKSANLAAILAPGRQALSAGWAIGGWFIPLGWFVLPRVVAGGVWRAAIPLEAHPTGRKPRTYLVTWWWLSFCVGETLLSTPVNATRGDLAASLAKVQAPFGTTGFADLCRVVSAVLGILMIRKVTQMQQIRILQGPGPGHPYAAPVAVNAPYAAYTEPSPAAFGVTAPVPGPVAAYGPSTGTPYAASQPTPMQPQPQAQRPEDVAPAPAAYAASRPPQTAPPSREALRATLVEPSEAVTEARPAVPEPVGEPAAEPSDAVPGDAVPSDAVPGDAAPADVPTTAIPRQVTPDRATVALARVADGAREPEYAAPKTEALAEPGSEPAAHAEPQDAVPSEPRDA